MQKIANVIVPDKPCVTCAFRCGDKRYRPRFKDDTSGDDYDGCCEDSDEDTDEDEEEIEERLKTIVCFSCLSTFSVPIQEA